MGKHFRFTRIFLLGVFLFSRHSFGGKITESVIQEVQKFLLSENKETPSIRMIDLISEYGAHESLEPFRAQIKEILKLRILNINSENPYRSSLRSAFITYIELGGDNSEVLVAYVDKVLFSQKGLPAGIRLKTTLLSYSLGPILNWNGNIGRFSYQFAMMVTHSREVSLKKVFEFLTRVTRENSGFMQQLVGVKEVRSAILNKIKITQMTFGRRASERGPWQAVSSSRLKQAKNIIIAMNDFVLALNEHTVFMSQIKTDNPNLLSVLFTPSGSLKMEGCFFDLLGTIE